MHWAVILAGGSGTRFWPLSSPSRPKQLLPLAGATSSAEEAVARLDGLIPRERILVVAGAALAPLLQDRLGLPAGNVLVEPRAASTAPALVWAAHEVLRRDPDADILALHADWHIPDPAAFRSTASAALATGRAHQALVTVGIVPTRAETGYGYLVLGQPLDHEAHRVARFTEKPDAATAAGLVASGALWNSGLFAWPARVMLGEVARHTPELAPHLDRLDAGDVAGFFAAVQPVSIDVGLLERSAAVVAIPGRFAWDDIGTWEALARVRSADAAGNIAVGPVHLVDSRRCIAWSDGTPIVASGVQDLVLVAANGRILVMDRARAADLKQTLDQLPLAIRDLPA